MEDFISTIIFFLPIVSEYERMRQFSNDFISFFLYLDILLSFKCLSKAWKAGGFFLGINKLTILYCSLLD